VTTHKKAPMKGLECSIGLAREQPIDYLEGANYKVNELSTRLIPKSNLIPFVNSPQLSSGKRFCVSNNCIPTQRKFNNCEVNPTYEGGINSVTVAVQGAVLPAVGNWLLIIGLMESTEQGPPIALIRRTVE